MENVSSSQQWAMDSALYLDKFLSVWQFTCAVVGIPLNLIVIAVVLGLRRLHLQRTFTWLIVGFANLIVLIYCLLEVVAVHWPSPTAGQLCAWLKGLPSSFITVSWFLSLLERHLCLKHPNWYKRNIPSCWTLLSLQTGSFVILFLLMKCRHFIFSAPLRLQWSLNDFKFSFGFALAGLLLCLVAHATVTIVSHKNYPPISAVVDWIALDPVEQMEQGVTEKGDEGPQKNSAFVCIGKKRISRLDLEAARSMVINCGTLIVSAVPATITWILWATCVIGTSSSELPTSRDCSDWVRAFLFTRLIIISIHCSFICPTIFVFLSRDVRSALRDRGLPWE